jgi:hypothetical protein
MKVSGVFKASLLSLALLLATSAFAANKGSLNLGSPTTVAGTKLAAGEYGVQWEGTGPEVQVNIMRGKKVVATVPAQVVTLDEASRLDSAVVKSNNDGSRSLSQIRFSGKKLALTVGEQSGGSAAGSSSN